ncbi:hypothetical protein LguiA_003782 [Lonicera macranthoides]
MDPTELIELDLDDNLVAANQLGKFHSVGKILSEMILTKAAIIKIAKSSWNTEEFFSMAAWGDNIFVFNFELQSDCSKIFEASPWAFMGFMMSLNRWDPSKTISEIDFNRCLFYVQIHDLPILKRSVENVEKIAKTTGNLRDIDTEDIDCLFKKKIVRIKVSIDVNQPLRKGFALKCVGLPSAWISFRYERLTSFCFAYGLVGHEKKMCRL